MCPRDDQKARAGKDREDVATGKFPLPSGTKKTGRGFSRPVLRCCKKTMGFGLGICRSTGHSQQPSGIPIRRDSPGTLSA